MFKDLFGSSRRELAYVATKNGIFTETGTWFAATEDSIRAYAARVLEVRPLPRLLADADVWLRSAQTLAVWSLIAFLTVLSPVPAMLAAVSMYAGWHVIGPSFVALFAVPIFRVLGNVILQGVVYVIVLSMFANAGVMLPVWVGLGGFIAFRWGLIQRALEPLMRPLHRSLYELPVPDQVLRAFIVRTALKHQIDVPQLREIERSIRDKWK